MGEVRLSQLSTNPWSLRAWICDSLTCSVWSPMRRGNPSPATCTGESAAWTSKTINSRPAASGELLGILCAARSGPSCVQLRCRRYQHEEKIESERMSVAARRSRCSLSRGGCPAASICASRASVVEKRAYARIPCTTCPCTSVSRKSRPL